MKKLSSAKQQEIARAQWDRYERARDNGHLDYIDMAKKCDAYYSGDQWDEYDKMSLEAEGRPALTINTVLPTINTVLGEQSSRRADIKFKPRRGGDEEVAHTLTKLYMQIADSNKLDWVEQQVFSDGLIMDGRGYFDARMDFSDHVEGEIRITAKDPLDILIDPDAKDADPKNWNEVFETKWMTLDEIEELYGKKKAEDLRFIAENGSSFGRDSIEYEETRFGDLDPSDDYFGADVPGDDEYRNVRSLRVIERQHKKLSRCDFFVDPNTGDQRHSPTTWSDQKKKKFAKQYGLNLISKMIKKVRWTVTCDHVVLHDDWSPYRDFTIIPFFAYFRRGKPFGMVRNLLSPQEQLNKIASQELHIVNTTANSGWMVESGSLVGMTADDLEEHGAETGLVLEYNRGSTPPTKINPNSIPTGLDRIAQKAQANIQSISGINDSMLGTDSAEVSGVAIQAKQNRGAVMIQVPLDNLRKSRQYLAERILDLIQGFYTEQRVIQVTNEDDPLKPREEMVVNQMTPEGEIINNLTIGEYDVVVATAPARDSFDEVQFAEALNLRQVGVSIPDDAIIEYSHLARKGELAKRIRMMTGVEQSEEQMQAAAMQQEIQMQQVQLELAKMQAEVQKLQSEAAVNMAKAQDTAGVAPQIRMQELQAKIGMKEQELMLRRELASLTNQTRTNQSQTNAATRIAATAMQTAAKKEAAKPQQVDIPNIRTTNNQQDIDMSDDKDENVNTTTFDVMPGADPIEEDDAPAIDLSFPDEPEAKEEETVEETVAEESEEVVAEEETEEPAEDVEPEAESEEEPEALKEPEPEPEVEEKPTEPKAKKPMVPKSRLDEVLAKQKELQKQLEDMRASQAAEEEAPEEYDFAAKEVEYQNALLDGEVEKATAVRTEIRKAERAQIEFEMTQKMTKTVSQDREANALQQAASQLENAFPQFNRASDQYDETLTNEVVELRDAFMMKGDNPVAALSKAARFVVREYDLVDNAEETPALASTPNAADEVAKKRKEVSRKLKAAESQPPEMPGESSAAKGESQYDINNMTEDEFNSLPEATLKRLRGDIL